MRNYYEGIRWVHERFRVFSELPQPIVVAVHGYCLGFGVELALMADIRLCADNAIFALPEAQVGVSIDAGGDLRLSHRGMAEALKFEALSASVEFVSEDMPAGYAAKAAKQPVDFEGK